MRLLACLGVWCLLAPCAPAGQSPPYRGYTVMADGLGRPPSGPEQMWGNTVQAHLDFVEQARLNLVVVEVPFGVNDRHPRSDQAARFIRTLQESGVEVWVIYPHGMAQSFDLPRQVDGEGRTVEWKACHNRPEAQDWLVDNGKAIVEAYHPDGLILFGTFHVGGACHCAYCREHKEARGKEGMERFFLRWKEELAALSPKLKRGTCDFWTEPSRKTLASLDLITPVVPIFRPDYAAPGQVKGRLSGIRNRTKDQLLVPYVKLFLATQTDSATEHVLAAAEEGVEEGDGFFLWGYNPGHCYAKQDYDHERIVESLAGLAPKQRRRDGE